LEQGEGRKVKNLLNVELLIIELRKERKRLAFSMR